VPDLPVAQGKKPSWWPPVAFSLLVLALLALALRPPADPLAPTISTTDIAVPAPHHFDYHYFNPTIGSVHQIEVPDVGWRLITFKGTIADLDNLPANPAPGDTYFCPKGGGYWVWAVLPGHTTPTWVDP
jgi:hypothetical protein